MNNEINWEIQDDCTIAQSLGDRQDKEVSIFSQTVREHNEKIEEQKKSTPIKVVSESALEMSSLPKVIPENWKPQGNPPHTSYIVMEPKKMNWYQRMTDWLQSV